MRRRAVLMALGAALVARPGTARCLIGCDEDIDPEAAVGLFEAELGAPLPRGVALLGMIDGGFQDRFIQVKLTGDDEGTRGLLALMGIDPEDMVPPSGEQTTIAPADWWDVEERTDRRVAEARLGGFAHARAIRAVDPDNAERVLIYVIAFQT